MLQIIVVYFGPYYMFRLKMGIGYRFPAVIIAFVINYAAYFAEIYRPGIESMPKGQYEAAEVLGYSKAQTFVRIILPQVIKRVLPSITNETITLVKDTSLAFTISIAEMFTVAKQIGAAQTSVVPLLAAGIEPCEKKFRWKRCFERHFVTGERRPSSFNHWSIWIRKIDSSSLCHSS